MRKIALATAVVLIIAFCIPLIALSQIEIDEKLDNVYNDTDDYIESEVIAQAYRAKEFESNNKKIAVATNASVLEQDTTETNFPSDTQQDGVSFDENCYVNVKMGKKVVALPLDEYLIGVVAGEMPPSFPIEALKAQAVAARTFTLYRMDNQQAKHPEAHVCSDYHCCKAYRNVQEEMKDWGENAQSYVDLYTSSVKDTDGVILTYEQQPILAVFHSSSNGRTENCEDVWGGDIPYLKSVETPDEDFIKTAEFSIEACKKKLLANWPKMKLDGKKWIGAKEYTQGGSVKKITLGGVTVSGNSIRNLFGLYSSDFEITVSGDKVIFTSKGYGHGVGMSQYGAKAYAEQGKPYDEIVMSYYQGAQVTKLYG